MNQSEQVAMRWITNHVHVLECVCGGRWVTPRSTTVVFHRCERRTTRASFDPPDREQDRQRWAATMLGAALESSVRSKYGDDTMLRGGDA